MIDFSNPWYLITLLGAPEVWSAFAAMLFGAYLAFRTGSMGGAGVRRLLFLLIPTLVLTFLLATTLKGFFGVPRQCVPCMTELVGCNPYCPIDSSLPSGHAATAFAGFTAFWLSMEKRRKWLLVYCLPFLVAASRIMLGVHTWLDVFAGAVLGIAVALAVWEIDKRID